MRASLLAVAALLSCAALFAACGEQAPAPPTVLRVGVLPDQAPEALRARYDPLVRFLEQRTGLSLDLRLASDYESFLADFVEDRIHLAWFGGLTFVQADAAGGALPLAMRDIDQRFTSCYLTGPESAGETIADFRGRRFAFGSRLSTSGHLMPRYFLEEQGIDPDDFFATVAYSGAHDATAFMVRDGEADLGVANALIVEAMFESGRLSRDEVRILTSTPPYPDYVWAVQPDLPESTRRALLGALLSLDRSNAPHAAILAAQGARAFLPASREDFRLIEDAAQRFGLVADDRTP